MPHPFRLYKENKNMVSNRPVYYQTKHNRKKNCLQRFCTAAMLHDRNNRFLFLWDKNVLSNAKHFHCSYHATWLPCKTSVTHSSSLCKSNNLSYCDQFLLMIYWRTDVQMRSLTIFVSLLYKKDGFHVAVRPFSNRSQNTSKCSKNITDTHA